MCISPIIVKNPRWNKVLFKSDRQYLAVPCGKCLECLNSRRNQWSYRLNVEARYYPDYLLPFVTLTYRDDSLVYDGNFDSVLSKDHFKKFIKSIRNDNPNLSFKYYGIGEYGETYYRPHYHILFFGLPNYLDFNKYWPFGLVHVGCAEPASIHYVAGYFLMLPDNHKSVKPFSLMSKGIGLAHFNQFKSYYFDYAKDNRQVSVGNFSVPLPRYFRKLVAREIPLPALSPQYSVHVSGDVFHLNENYVKTHVKPPKI